MYRENKEKLLRTNLIIRRHFSILNFVYTGQKPFFYFFLVRIFVEKKLLADATEVISTIPVGTVRMVIRGKAKSLETPKIGHFLGHISSFLDN